MTIPDTMSPLEAVWVATYTVAVVLALWGLREACLDDQAVRHRDGDSLSEDRVVSRGSVRREIIRTMKQAVLLIAGIVASTAPQGPLSEPGEWKAVVVSGGITLVGWLFVATTLLDCWTRRRANALRASRDL